MTRNFNLISTLLCCCMAVWFFPSCKKDDNTPKEPEKAKSVTLKAMSFNIRHTGEASDTGDKHWDNRKAAVVNMIKTEKPDIIGFQEATNAQIKYVADELGAGYNYIAPGNNKVILFSTEKFIKKDASQYYMSETPEKASAGWDGDTRMTAWMKLQEKSTGKIFYFFDTHMSVTGVQARIKGAELNVNMMKSICGEKSAQMIVGDMNTSDDAALHFYSDYLTSSRKAPLTDDYGTCQGWTRTPATATKIDYIFARNVKLKKHTTLIGDYYGVTYISDHWPIMLEFELGE